MNLSANLNKNFISFIEKFPPIPTNLQKLIKLLNDENSNFNKLEKEIAYNQSLSVNLLRLANSAYYGYNQSTASIAEAVKRVGINTVKKIAHIELIKTKLNKDLNSYKINARELWKHSLSTAIIAEYLSSHKYPSFKSKSFITGLVIDIGKICIDNYLSSQNIILFDEKNSINENYILNLERKIIATDHAEIGGLILKNWNFPEEIVLTIKYHHNPEDAPANTLKQSAIIHIADLLSLAAGYGYKIDKKDVKLSPKALKILNLKFDEVFELIEYNLINLEELIQRWLV